MADLPTNYYDDILSASMNGKKKFRLTYRNGTTEEVTIEDISEYDQHGSKFGAGDINKTNQAVNEKFDSGDVVDPMLTTEPGFAADAYQTKLRLEECFQSVSDGKALVASAITDKKVPTDATDTFAEMEANIRKIRLGSGNATAADVKKGKTFTNDDGVEYTGTYDFAAETSANAVASQITVGYTAWVNGKLIPGTRPLPVNKQSGSVTFAVAAASSSGSKTTDYLVIFTSAFEKVPSVTAAATSLGQHFTVSTFNVTQTSFYIRVVNHTLYGSQEVTFNWVAQSQ